MKETKSDKKAPEYKIIENISISPTLLINLIKFCENSTNFQIEGLIFGHEGENEITIENALPMTPTVGKDEVMNIVIIISKFIIPERIFKIK